MGGTQRMHSLGTFSHKAVHMHVHPERKPISQVETLHQQAR